MFVLLSFSIWVISGLKRERKEFGSIIKTVLQMAIWIRRKIAIDNIESGKYKYFHKNRSANDFIFLWYSHDSLLVFKYILVFKLYIWYVRHHIRWCLCHFSLLESGKTFFISWIHFFVFLASVSGISEFLKEAQRKHFKIWRWLYPFFQPCQRFSAHDTLYNESRFAMVLIYRF